MRLRDSIRNLPLRRKVTLLLLTPCVVALLSTGFVLLAFHLNMLRRDFARDLDAVADIVGANSIAAVTFNDPKAATEVMASFKAKSHIVSAILVLPDGPMFAQYGQHAAAPVIEVEDRFTLQQWKALMIKPVRLEGKQVATLNVISDYRTVYAGLRRLVIAMLVTLVVVGAAVAALLSRWLQRLISDPVLDLVNSIQGIVWECTTDVFRFSFVSRQSERLLGYAPGQWMADRRFWHEHLHPDDAAQAIQTSRDFMAAGKPYSYEYRMIAADGRVVWIRESGSVQVEHGKAVTMRGIFQDITAEKKAADELARLHRRLLETSRLAGMAEVATGVLHNVGNVLNSVSVSASLVTARLRQSKVPSLRRATAMLHGRNGDLAQFLTQDPKGRVLPEYLAAVSEHLGAEQSEMLKEIVALTQNIEHIKEIVAMQQGYAKVSGAFEDLSPTDLIEDALRINAAAFERHRIELVREYKSGLPRVNVDRHKVLQILINVLRNAKDALDAGDPPARRLLVGVESAAPGIVSVRIRDNGVGIAAENLSRIFGLGFTTKKDGHGFGLHSAGNAAKEMGGRLSAHSDGPGQGAEFTLELPVASSQTAANANAGTPSET